MVDVAVPQVPSGNADERELLLSWLDYLRELMINKSTGLSDEAARWTPEGALIPLLGIVTHLRCVELRWIDGAMKGLEVSRDEREFRPEVFPGMEHIVNDREREQLLAIIRGVRRHGQPPVPEDAPGGF